MEIWVLFPNLVSSRLRCSKWTPPACAGVITSTEVSSSSSSSRVEVMPSYRHLPISSEVSCDCTGSILLLLSFHIYSSIFLHCSTFSPPLPPNSSTSSSASAPHTPYLSRISLSSPHSAQNKQRYQIQYGRPCLHFVSSNFHFVNLCLDVHKWT